MENAKIRSIQFIDTYFPLVDGVIQTVHNYATIMNKTGSCMVIHPDQKRDFDYSTLEYTVYTAKSSHIINVAEYPWPTPNKDKVLKDLLEKYNADIFHVHSPFQMSRFATSYGKKAKIPCVATFHSKYYDDALHITGSKILAEIVKKYVVESFNRADSVWACSEGTANTLRSYGFKKPIFVMDNGSSMEIPQEERIVLKEKAKKELDFDETKHNILFIGHLIWHKNIKLVLDTFKKLCNESDDYRLMIIGEGYNGEEIRKYADELSFGDSQLRFTGKISDRQLLAGAILNSDLLFFPSVYDNSPLVVRESASLGTPSLLTEGSNSAEVIRKDVSGFCAKENVDAMYEEIKKIFADPELLANVSKQAEIMIPKTWKQIVSLVTDKYTEIIEKYRFDNKL